MTGSSRTGLAAIEAIIDVSGTAPQIQALLPRAVRRRQLPARTLLIGMHLTVVGGRPAHLTRVRQALTSLPQADQERPGVTVTWKTGPHQLTYRQTEHTARLITWALSKDQPGGAPSPALQSVCDALLEASIPEELKHASTALAGDWTDIESWSGPPRHDSTKCADPEAHWGHRNSSLPGPKGDMFYGYYLSLAVMTREENRPPVSEPARRMTAGGCDHDPVRALVPVLEKMPEDGIPPGDFLAGSGYAHRGASAWAIPMRQAGASLVQDLMGLNDRGPRGTHQGAIIANGSLYCPQTPKPLLEPGPLPPGAPSEQTAAHDQQAAKLARHKLGRHTGDDADGYHRVTCPAIAGKIRCPLRPQSLALPRDRPEILTPPQHPAACCTQQTVTVPPSAAAKTRQKHDTPQRTGGTPAHGAPAPSEPTPPSRTPPPPASPAAGSWLLGLTPLTPWLACTLDIRNQRILTAFDSRQQASNRRAAAGLPPAPPDHPRPARRPALTAAAPRATARQPEHHASTPPATHALTTRKQRAATAQPHRKPRNKINSARAHEVSDPDVNMEPGEV